MATLYKRGDSYYLNWCEGGRQKRKSLGKLAPQDAERRRIEKELQLVGGWSQEYHHIPFAEHANNYLEWHRVKFPDSHQRVRQITEQAFGEFYDKPLHTITKQDIERWLARRETRVGFDRHKRQAVVASETAAKELRTLKAILNKAVEWGKVAKSPAQGVRPPKNKRSRPIHFYSREELQRLYVETEHGHIWRLMANTGMRRAEAQQLQWAHVDFQAAEIQVLSTEEERTKSGKWRPIPMTEGARQALELLKLETGGTPYVLPRMTGPSLSRAFLRDCARLGLKGSLHSLRHSYGAHLVMAGVPLRTVQVLMGHQSFTTTERYAHVAKDHLREAARAVSL